MASARRTHREIRIGRSTLVATGTLACPSCDAPVAPGEQALTPAGAFACPFCDHAGAVRDFLSLASPSRPAHVAVRAVAPRRAASGPPGAG